MTSRKELNFQEYIDLIFKAALRPDEPSLDAIDEAIKLVELTIKKNKETGLG